MDTLYLIRMQLRLECIGFDERGFLTRLPGENPDEIARLYVYRHLAGFSLFFRDDVSIAVQQEIKRLGPEQAYLDRSSVSELLTADHTCEEFGAWETYILTRTIPLSEFRDVLRLTDQDFPSRPLYAILKDGLIISGCKSVRENEQAGECYVFAEEQHRQQGYARQVTAAWVHDISRQGKTAFYSHSTGNEASSRLAKSLEFEHQFSLVTYK